MDGFQNDVVQFQQYYKNMRMAFNKECADLMGDNKSGCGKLADAAWFIASGSQSVSGYVHGSSRGTARSYEVLHFVRRDAIGLFKTLLLIKDRYSAGLVLPIVRSEEPIDFLPEQFLQKQNRFPTDGREKVNNGCKVFDQNAEDECYKRYKKIQYRNLIIKSLLSFALGLLLSFLLRLLFG